VGKQAEKLLPKTDPKRLSLLHNLSWALGLRFEKRYSENDLENAIKIETLVVKLSLNNDIYLPSCLSYLRKFLGQKFKLYMDDDNLDKGIKRSREAVRLSFADLLHLTMICQGLA